MEVEQPEIEYFAEQQDDSVDILSAEAQVEDLGKRKHGTNDARDAIVKRLRDTPPNANTAQGGFREVPVQGMPSSSASYKTYKVKRDPYIKEAKETMSKPVAVPLD